MPTLELNLSSFLDELMGWFERYLSVWIALAIVAGVGLGAWFPGAATGVAGGAVLRRSGWFDAGLIHSSAESLH